MVTLTINCIHTRIPTLLLLLNYIIKIEYYLYNNLKLTFCNEEAKYTWIFHNLQSMEDSFGMVTNQAKVIGLQRGMPWVLFCLLNSFSRCSLQWKIFTDDSTLFFVLTVALLEFGGLGSQQALSPCPMQDAYAMRWGMTFCSYTPVNKCDQGPSAKTPTSSPP